MRAIRCHEYAGIGALRLDQNLPRRQPLRGARSAGAEECQTGQSGESPATR